MKNRMYLVRCPHCAHDMKYQENLNSPHKKSNISSKVKRCVYCGKSFKVKDHIISII